MERTTRTEDVDLSLSAIITKENIKFLTKQAKILGVGNAFTKGDQLNISYFFRIDYLSDIDRRLTAILAITKRKDIQITLASVVALNHSKILINEILRKMEELAFLDSRKGMKIEEEKGI
jgi:hypothetical protein